MKFNNLKNTISKNLFALSGWIGLIILIIVNLTNKNLPPDTLGLLIIPISVSIFFSCLGISLIIHIIELITDNKIKNDFILNNKFYNIFWFLGTIFTLLFIFIGILFFLYMIAINFTYFLR